MGGRGGSYSRGANFSSVLEAQTALNNEGLFKSYVTLMEYDYSNPNDLGTPVVDLKTANAIYDVVHQIATEFPMLKGTMYCLSPEALSADTYAHCHMYSGEVNISKKFFSDWDKLSKSVEHDVQSGWHPQGTENPKSIIAHEIGHAIDGYLTIKKNMFGYTPGGNYKYASSVLRPKVMKAAGYKVSDVGKAVSRYATTNAKEWFAESFSEYVSSSNPRPAAAAFGRELKKLLKNL